MKIKWFGQSCFRLTAENGTTIVIDPCKMFCYKLPEIDANIVTFESSDQSSSPPSASTGSLLKIRCNS